MRLSQRRVFRSLDTSLVLRVSGVRAVAQLGVVRPLYAPPTTIPMNWFSRLFGTGKTSNEKSQAPSQAQSAPKEHPVHSPPPATVSPPPKPPQEAPKPTTPIKSASKYWK